MIKAIKIRLFPTKEQEILMLKTIGCSRFVYNWALNRCNELYKQGIKYNMSDIRKEFTQLKKKNNFKWLNEVSNTTMVESMRNLDRAFKSFFKKIGKYPRFKTKRKSRQSFYVRYDNLYFKENVCNIEKVGKVKFKTNYKIPNCKYSNPYCNFDGKYWYLSLGFKVEESQTTLNQDLSVGIDLGVKDLAIVNCLDKPIKNINKSVKVRKLKKRLKRLQRQVSRKYEANKQGNKFIKTNNIIKLEKEIKLIHRRLSNIRLNHIHQATNMIVKLRPYRVVMEDLNISGMMKNKHLAKAIAEQCLYEFIRQMKYKCEFNRIEFIQTDRFYPSSKTCSNCGYVKKDLKLKDRIYVCPECGLEIDRDKNASINLGNYKIA
ncbi:transposase [Clostridium botulinum B str. Osaka05]|uniref:Transposase n=1 Tax=Clostridium botulinum B str. Osaka05 TaxID=1407017 RepID=A0A060N9J5_CLOBO|nr:RNA-guided endonuclease TnpB family protein [Clostridium botulinum]BAO04894.1 transposase [Clostridium botulinum B str. Osaka05]